VYDLPSGLTLEVSGEADSVLLPYRPEIIREVDLGARVVRIAAPPGLFG
jgi:ribosomal 30S subunit maturation factor RimM